MKYFISLFVALFISGAIFAQETGVIEGQVLDRDTQQEIIGAKVEVVGTKLGTITNAFGTFQLKGLTPGTYRLRVTAPEYKSTIRSDVRVGSTQSTKLSIELKIDSYAQGEVVITATRSFEQKEDTRVSSNVLTQEEIRRAPGSAEDVSRMVQVLPGVVSGSDARNDIIARGGSPSENFLMVDGIEVPNINHYAAQGASGGPIGMINVDFLNDVNFSAGGFGAKYGDRLSSIMDIKYRDGDKRDFHGKFDMGLGGFGAIVEGPIQTEKSSFLFSARRSYLDLILGGTGLTGVPNYWNFNLKGTLELSPNHQLALIGLGGIDQIRFKDFSSDNVAAVSNQDLNYDAWQFVAGVSHRWLISNTTFVRTSVSTNTYYRDVRGDSVSLNASNEEIGRTLDFRNESTDRENVLIRSDFSHRISPLDLVEVGLVMRSITSNNDIFLRAGTDASGFNPNIFINQTTNAFKAGAYTQYTRNFGTQFSVTAGVRWDYFDYISDQHAFSPRISATYEISENLRFNVGGGLYQQAPSLFWLIADERNRQVDWMKTYQAVAGFEFFPDEDLKISVEAYTKEYRDYPISGVNPQFIYSSAGAGFDNRFEYIFTGSNGYARGIEFFIQKKLTDKFYGMLSYGFSDIRFVDGFGTERSSAFDYRHVLTAIGGYKITDALEVSAKFRFAGGRPYTPFDLAQSQSLNRGILDYANTNSARFNDYRRLDIRIDYRFNLVGWNMLFFIDLQNVANFENVEQIIWNNKQNREDRLLQWQFLPVGGFKAEF
ncbi:MAG: TonB-dependent receptor [Chloroherpetonaceae bacterium]|nr:TonB-dependent receptor [Chloroherpetonaceae bacterium]